MTSVRYALGATVRYVDRRVSESSDTVICGTVSEMFRLVPISTAEVSMDGLRGQSSGGREA